MAENTWSHYYSDRKAELNVFADDREVTMIFSINGEEIFENGIDTMTEEERRKYLEDNYSAEIEDIMESRGL